MGIKPGPKRIAKSTGKPDRRQRDNKKKRQVTHLPSNLIITKGGLRICHWIFCPVAYSFYKQRSVVSIYFFMKTVYFSFSLLYIDTKVN